MRKTGTLAVVVGLVTFIVFIAFQAVLMPEPLEENVEVQEKFEFASVQTLPPPPAAPVVAEGIPRQDDNQQTIPLSIEHEVEAESPKEAPALKKPILKQVSYTEGEKMLSQLERDTGPEIEIEWAASDTENAALFEYLHDCLGMRLATLQGARLTSIEGGGGKALMSGFIRNASGFVSPRERSIINQLPGSGRAVRLFPKRVDVRLLTGLAALVGDRLMASGSVKGRYHLSASNLMLTAIRVDESRVQGSIALARGCYQ